MLGNAFSIPVIEHLLEPLACLFDHERKELGTRVRHQLRSIPELKFFIDDTLDYVFKMEELFEKIKKEEGPNTTDETESK